MNRYIPLLFLTLILLNAKAQVFSPQQLISESPDEPYYIVASDLNNDGYDDVVYSSIQDNKIRCNFYNPQTEKFDEGILLGSQFPYCISLDVADLDNDGLKDILAVSQTGKKVGWYKNNGNGNFEIQPFINDNAPLAASVYAVDIDLDGDMDVLSAQKGDNTVLLYKNDGTGNFPDVYVITSSAHIPVVVRAADLNNDGYPDIISGYGQSDEIVYFINNGDGTFQPETVITNQADYITSIVTADLNNDGYVDIISTSKNDNKVAWYKNLEGESFSPQIIITDNLLNAFGLTVADFDLDGDMDIVATSPNDYLIILFKNNNLEFEPFVVSSEIKEPNGVAAGDFNNDGLVDIVSCDSWSAGYTNMIYWYINGASCFVTHHINEIISSWHLAIDDFNNDGNADIFYCDGQEIRYLVNNNSGDELDDHLLYSGGYNIVKLAFADAFNDNYADLFVADAMGDMLLMFKNENGEFKVPEIIDSQGDGPVSIDFTDIDNDGDLDFVTAFVNGNKIALYYNNNGNFTKNVIANPSSLFSSRFSDFDNDGDQDVVYSDYQGIKILENKGSGNFELFGQVVSYGTYSDDVEIADLNNDGYDDIVCNPDSVHWLINNHDKTYTDHSVETWGGPYCVETGDMDNDGYIDILSGSGQINRAYVLKNMNNGEDFSEVTYAVDQDIREISIGDINNDGYKDFVIGSWPAENLSWAENYFFRIIRASGDIFACEGGNAVFSTVTAGVSEFQWQMNDGSGWNDLSDNTTFYGVNKALLEINNVGNSLFDNEFRCKLKDNSDNIYYTEPAILYRKSAQISCIDDQVRTADESNTYTITGNEFDPDTLINPCLYSLILENSFNGQSTLEGAVMEPGNYNITWWLKNDQNEVEDSCTFNVEIEPVTGLVNAKKNDIIFFPNPFSNNLTVDLKDDNHPYQITISSVDGKIVYKNVKAKGKVLFELNGLKPGVYVLTVKNDEYIVSHKIIREP